MKSSKKIKLFLISAMLLLAFVFIGPKVYTVSTGQSKLSTITIPTEPEIKSQSTEDSDMEELDKPAYFNIFKFIFSFLPVNTHQDEKVLF